TMQASRLPLSTVETYGGESGFGGEGVYPVREWAPEGPNLAHGSKGGPGGGGARGTGGEAGAGGGQGGKHTNPRVGGGRRGAAALRGSSWKLSGGSQWSAGPTNASKKPQVLRATRRSWARSAPARNSSTGGSGWLTRQATAGAPSHNSSSGSAAGREAGATPATSAPSSRGQPSEGHITPSDLTT